MQKIFWRFVKALDRVVHCRSTLMPRAGDRRKHGKLVPQDDADARDWLAAMGHRIERIENVIASKPHGEKADVEVRVKTSSGEKREGISLKLVSSPNGFNQIDKRWLAAYAKKWRSRSP